MIKRRIHILGASGSGTTTLGRLLSQRLHIAHFDADDYYWLKTEIPYTEPREKSFRQELLKIDLLQQPEWVLTGSLCGWGDFTMPYYTLVVFLYLPVEIRLKRLKEREIQRYGIEAISLGGWFYNHSNDFLEWAAGYDVEGFTQRSRQLHEQWLQQIPCRVLRLNSLLSPGELADKVEETLNTIP